MKNILDLLKAEKTNMGISIFRDGEKEHKAWWDNGQLGVHCFINKNKQYHGECKRWNKNGSLFFHSLYSNGDMVKDYLDETT